MAANLVSEIAEVLSPTSSRASLLRLASTGPPRRRLSLPPFRRFSLPSSTTSPSLKARPNSPTLSENKSQECCRAWPASSASQVKRL